ncbi:DUF2945 domain-containing protein [Sulfitobacter sp.]|uniref:DUF2945 domain-containing protein n=1 Tax=Sulfitobacter sp. TaxID=1903071 RepID=UPI003563FC8B
MAQISEGSKVKWDWGQGTATGTVQEEFTESVTRTLKGSEVTRNGSEDTPAYLIAQDDGDEVLKLSTEVEAA